ncbi:MAG: hypothetical protein SGBAC_003290 [Bacillariaceae sp.]
MGKKSKKKNGRGTAHNKKVTDKSSRSVFAPFEIGQRVTIRGLKQASKFNGKTGTIISLQEDSGSRYGVSVNGHKIAVLPSNLEGSSSTATKPKICYDLEEELLEQEKKNCMDVDSMAAMRMMMNMFTTEEQQLKMYGRKIKPLPDFCSELRDNGGGFPKDVSPNWANRYLRTAFELSSNLPHVFEMYLKSPGYKPETTDILKRVGTNMPAKIDWFCERREIGDIFPHIAYPYNSNIRHSYSNQAYRQEVLLQGTTHVAVGFVDLGILLEADLQGPPKLGMNGPLSFLGIETSPYAVAKTLVVWEMLLQFQNQHHLRSVMQLWYSTTWDEETEEYVKQALANLCVSDEKRNPKVDALLRHWRDASSMSLQNARAQWQSRSTNDRSFIANFERRQDRIDMAKYELTGDFGMQTNRKPTYGNIVMFDCPKGTAPLLRNETVFSCLNWSAIASSLSPKTAVFEAAQLYIMERLLKVAGWAKRGMITLKLVCDDVQNMTDEIAATKPWTISWSNVLDYIDYPTFHKLARACSIHGDTLHFGYSMKWPTDVYGVSIIDFEQKEFVAFRKAILEGANKSVEMQYRMLGWAKYLRLPPPTNPINTTAFLLEMKHYENWADHFFEIGRHQGSCNVGHIEHSSGSPLSPTGSSTVSFTWTYDPEINFRGKSNSYF